MLRQNPNRMRAVVTNLTHNVNAIFKQRWILCFALFLAQNSVFADSDLHPDLKLSLNGRTYPIGVQMVSTLGLAYPVWGDVQTWKYGYVRAGLNLMSSVVVNRAGIELQLFPISILGVTAGYDTGVRNFVPKWLDCNVYECTGRADRKHIRLNAMAAYAGFSFAFLAKYEELRGFGSNKSVFDETTLLVGRRSGEHVFTMSPALLYRVAERTQVGLVSLYSRAIDTGGYSHLYGPVVNFTPEPKLNALVGVGLNSSPVAHSAMSGFFLLQYNVEPSLGVADLALRTSAKNINRDASESPKQ